MSCIRMNSTHKIPFKCSWFFSIRFSICFGTWLRFACLTITHLKRETKNYDKIIVDSSIYLLYISKSNGYLKICERYFWFHHAEMLTCQSIYSHFIIKLRSMIFKIGFPQIKCWYYFCMRKNIQIDRYAVFFSLVRH